MTTWNLAVNLRAQGRDLIRTLTEGAAGARHMGREITGAERGVRTLGAEAQRAARQVRTLGRDSEQSGRMQRTAGREAEAAGRNLRTLSREASQAARSQRTTARAAQDASRDFQRLAREMRTAQREMLALARSSATVARGTRTAGREGERAMGRFARATGLARGQLRSTAALLAGGGLFIGIHGLVENGNELQQQMNTLRGVTGANAVQMARASAVAKQLGEDLTLPKTSATDAAEAMVDLAKAGFRVDQAISASRASLELSTGLNVKAADAAMYLGDVMDQFALGADQAGKAADTLAATATGASGGIKDVWYAMKYAGPVANALHISLQETAAAVVGLGKAGIIGQTAGTTLRGALSNLAAPTDKMRSGLKTLGIQAFDASGNFKGLAYVIEQLHGAQQTLDNKTFVGAVKDAFGKPAMSGMIALGHQGVTAFQAASRSVSTYGTAARIAGSQSKGLVGAMTQLKTQTKTTGQVLYAAMAPGLEKVTRLLTSGLAKATPHLEHAIKYVQDLGTLFGPSLAAKVQHGLGSLASQARKLAGPLKDLGANAAADALHLLMNAGRTVWDVLQKLIAAVQPIGKALGDLATGSGNGASALGILTTALDDLMAVVRVVANVLEPIGHAVAGLVHAFGALPGPVQTAVTAMLLMRRFTPMFSGLATTVGGRVTGAFASFGQQMRVQQGLAAASGQSLSRMGAAFATLQARSRLLGGMSATFRNVQSSIVATGGSFARLRGGAAGAAAALGTGAGIGLRGAASGLVGFFGGPWGVALAGAGVALGLLAQQQQKAAQAAAEHEQRISNLASALRESNGVIDTNVRAAAAQQLVDTKVADGKKRLVDVMKNAGVSVSDLTTAYLDQHGGLDKLQQKLDDTAKANVVWVTTLNGAVRSYNDQGLAADMASHALGKVKGELGGALQSYRDYAAAVQGSGTSVSAYTRLSDAAKRLADNTGDADSRTRALKDALDLLSGGSVSFQAAEARLNQAILSGNDAIANGINHTDGWGKQLIGLGGAINTSTKNGQQLYNSLNDISDASANAAVSAFQLAQTQKKSLPDSIAAATKEMQKARDAAIAQAKSYGFNEEQAKKVADAMGLIPGNVAILLQTQGVDTTLGSLLAVQAQLKQTPDSKTIKVDTLDAGAQKKLKDLGFKVETIPGTREIKVTVQDDAARARLNGFLIAQGQVQSKSISINVNDFKGRAQLTTLQQKIRETKGKSVTMGALTKGAEQALRDLGFKVTHMPDGRVQVTIPTGPAKAAADTIAGYVQGIPDGYVTVHINGVATNVNPKDYYSQGPHSYGGVIGRYAGGGTVPGYAPRHDVVPAILSPGEGILVPEAVRALGGAKAIDMLNAWGRYGTARRFADGGVAGSSTGVRRYADGGFVYAPTDPRRSASDVMSRYSDAHQPITKDDYNKAIKKRADAVDTLRAAEARLNDARRRHRSHAQIVAAETAVAKARRNLTAATQAAQAAEARYRNKFSLTDYAKQLAASVKANAQWEANLKAVGRRGGTQVEEMLRGLGEEGASLVAALAKASNKQFGQIIANLKKLAPEARATLADYTAQLNAANGTTAAFQQNLAKLAAMGYGDLAAQLSSQGDAAAQKIAAEAVKNKKAAAAANTAAKKNANALSGDQLTELLQIIAAIKTNTTGIHDVAAATGLDEDEVIAVSNKGRPQISKNLGGRASRYLTDLDKANKGLAYENGGIRAGIYATAGGIVRFAEPQTHGEGYVPLGLRQRPQATAVMQDLAGRFGMQLVGRQDAAAGATRVIVVRQDGPLIGQQTITVDRPGATEQQIADAVGYQVRRAKRGGVARG